jgi:hypothetical protein
LYVYICAKYIKRSIAVKKTAMSLGKRLLALSIVAVLVALTACGGGTPSPTASAKPTAASPTGTAKPGFTKVTVTLLPVKGPPKVVGGSLITAPKAGTVFSNNIWVQLDLTNINLVNPKSTNVEGEGHVIFYQDIDPIPTTAGQPAVPSPLPSGGKIYRGGSAIAQNLGYQWRNIPNGNHTFSCQVVQNDGTPLNPPIFMQVKVKIEGEFPSGAPPSPTPTAKK